MAAQPIYQFYTELIGFESKLWRRFQMMGGHSIARLCYNLMTMYEMLLSHLFFLEQVVVDSTKDPQVHRTKRYDGKSLENLIMEYWIPDMASELDLYDEFMDDLPIIIGDSLQEKVKTCFHEPGEQAILHYDLGDDWMVRIVLESIFHDEQLSGRALPRVLEGEGFGIVEDCGGASGLTVLARAFKYRFGRDYEELRIWLGIDELDLEHFDLDDMNRRLKRIPGLYAKVCEQDYELTQTEIDYLERADSYKERR